MPLTVKTLADSQDDGVMNGTSECDPLSPHVRFYGPHNRTDLSIDDTDSSIGRSGMSSSNDFESSTLNRSGEFRALRWQRGCLKHFMTSEGCTLQGCPFLHELTKQEIALLIAQTKKEHHILFSTSHSSSLNESGFDEHNTPSHHLAVSGGGVPETLLEHPETEEEHLNQPEIPQDEDGEDLEDGQDDGDEDAAPRQERRKGTQRWEVQEKQTSDWVRHSCGICKPCFFFATPEGCTDSDNCRFCHFPHDLTGQRIKLRPCKGKRDRYRKFLNRVTQEMQALENPDDFDVETLQLPNSVLKNDVLKRMFLTRVIQHVEGVKAKLKAGLVPEILGEDNGDNGDNSQANTQTTSETVPDQSALSPMQQQQLMPTELLLKAPQQDWREAAFQHQQQQQQQQQDQQQQQQQQEQQQDQQQHQQQQLLEQQQKWNQAPPPPSAKPCPQAGGVVNCGTAALRGRSGRVPNPTSRRSVISL